MLELDLFAVQGLSVGVVLWRTTRPARAWDAKSVRNHIVNTWSFSAEPILTCTLHITQNPASLNELSVTIAKVNKNSVHGSLTEKHLTALLATESLKTSVISDKHARINWIYYPQWFNYNNRKLPTVIVYAQLLTLWAVLNLLIKGDDTMHSSWYSAWQRE